MIFEKKNGLVQNLAIFPSLSIPRVPFLAFVAPGLIKRVYRHARARLMK